MLILMQTKFKYQASSKYAASGKIENEIKLSHLKQLIRDIRSPLFTHARTRNWCGAEIATIYHRAGSSPSGVLGQSGGDDSLVAFLLRRYKRTSPLSPTEGLNYRNY